CARQLRSLYAMDYW
nr:immunoglobulin heavy chain junction region [Mus musculus]MBK4189868.1 immunoglobulin heavy chain junction region [Mus musculus]